MSKKHKPCRVTGKFAAIFKRDEKRWGREVALHNYGFLRGWHNGEGKGHDRGFAIACRLIVKGGKWTARQRRLCERATGSKKRVL
jgi:hypothetical protein